MARLKIRHCPKCGSGLFIDKEMDSWYEWCINCSYRNELKASVVVAPEADTTTPAPLSSHKSEARS